LPSLDELFIKAAAFHRHTFPTATPRSVMLHLLEEVRDEILASEDGLYDVEEYADVFILLAGGVTEIDHSLLSFREAVDKKIAKNAARTWREPDENGIVRHASEGEEFLAEAAMSGEGGGLDVMPAVYAVNANHMLHAAQL
jgi:hypothetical protein